ncbi:unnamed protein product, partial [Prorocentrum cordatum]
RPARPCEPSPLCHRLLDGVRARAAGGGAAGGAKEPHGRRQQRRAGAANGTGIEAGDVAPAVPAAAADPGGGIDMGFMVRARAKVFLGQRAYISKVVIFCVPASDGNGGDVGTGGPHRRTLIVTAWMGEAGGPLEDDADAGGHT